MQSSGPRERGDINEGVRESESGGVRLVVLVRQLNSLNMTGGGYYQ